MRRGVAIPARRESAADQRDQQHRQRRCQQGRTGPLHADVDRRTQEKRKIEQHSPVAELEGGQQSVNPGHGRGREHPGIKHGARTAPLLPDKQDRRCLAANEAGGSEDQAVAPQQRIDRQAQRNRQQGDADGIQPSLSLVVRLGDQQWHRQGQGQAEGDVCKKIRRQPSHEARKPPRVGPRAMATPEITPMTPNARAR